MIGLFLLGIPEAFINILGILDLLDTLKFDKKIDNLRASDYTSAIYNIALYLGESLGPIIGGLISYYEGFELCCISIGVLNIIFAILFTIFIKNLLSHEEVKCYPLMKSKSDLVEEHQQLSFIKLSDDNMSLDRYYNNSDSISNFNYILIENESAN